MQNMNNTALHSATKEDQAFIGEVISPQPEKVEALVKEFETIELFEIEKFGNQVQKEISQFSTVLLDAMQENQMANMNQSIKETVAKISAVYPSENQGFFKKLFAKRAYSKQLEEQFTGLELEIDQIARLMNQLKIVLLKDIALLEELYKRNLKGLQELTNYVAAGEQAVARLKASPGADTGAGNGLMLTKEQGDIKKLSRRVEDLKTTKLLSMQMAPQIRLMQNNDQILLGKIQEIVSTTLPLWKNQISLSLGLANTQQALDAQKNISHQAKTALTQNKKLVKGQEKALKKTLAKSKKETGTLEKNKQELVQLFEKVIDEQNHYQNSRNQIQTQLKHVDEELKG